MQWAAPLAGRAMIELGDTRRGLRVLEEGLAAHTITRSALLRPYYFVLLAGGLIRCGELAPGAAGARRVGGRSPRRRAQRAYESEHARLQAELLALATRRRSTRRKRTISARSPSRGAQGAKWLELRAARAYAHYMLKSGARQEARDVLAPVCAWFTEGFDTLDYLYADGLLKTLG